MVMTTGVARGSIIVGTIGLVVATLCVSLGIASNLRYSRHASKSAGLWTLLIIEGELDRKLTKPETKFAQLAMMAFALFFNIIATIVSVIGTFFCIGFWMVLNTYEELGCDQTTYKIECSKVNTAIVIIAILTIFMAILSATTFVGSILGCMGTCCAPQEPVIIMNAVCQPSTVVVSTQSNTHYAAPFFQPMAMQNVNTNMSAQGYVGPPAPAYGVQNASMTSVNCDNVQLLETF